MDCGCSIDCDFDVDVGPSFFCTKNRTAKTVHTCYECRRKINPGEKYLVETGVWDGRFDSYKTCADCTSIRDVYFCSFVYGTLEEEMRQMIHDENGEILDGRILFLTPGAKQMVFNWIEDFWKEYYDGEDE